MKIKINKKALSLLLSSCILITTNVYAELENKGDYISTDTNINMRFGEEVDRKKIGLFQKNNTAYRILTIDGWDLINYNNKLGFVKTDYITSLEIYEESNIKHTEENDLLTANTNINLRLSPEISNNKIDLIKKGSLLTTIAITNNNWYIVKYNGKIGYISADLVTSLKREIKENYNIDINIKDIVYLNKNDYLLDSNGIPFTLANKYESAYLLYENNDFSLIKTNKTTGFIYNSSITKLDQNFIDIDLYNQKIKLYDDIDILIQSDMVSGKIATPTREGYFKIYNKQTDRYLKGEDYNTYVNYWMPFDGGIGLHDATWRSKFGDEIYIKKGSHGCVNLPYNVAEYIYQNINVGTKVLVHK